MYVLFICGELCCSLKKSSLINLFINNLILSNHMKKNDVTPEIQSQIVNLNKRLGKNHGAAVMQALGESTKSDPQAAQFQVGDELYVDDNV